MAQALAGEVEVKRQLKKPRMPKFVMLHHALIFLVLETHAHEGQL